jgi:putative phage-type endonuclease
MATSLGLTAEQLALRKQGIGASEVPAILGLDSYRTALDVFLDKTSQAEPMPENRYTRWGHRLEAVIADEYAERHPEATLRTCDTEIGPEPWMLATPDRLVIGMNLQHPSKEAQSEEVGEGIAALIRDALGAERWGLECKSRGLYNRDAWGEHGTDEVPHAVAAQCHWGMMVSGLKRWDVAVLLGGNDYREYTLRADAAIHAGLYESVRAFWFNHVQAGVHPPFTGAESDHRFLFRTYPGHTSEIVKATSVVNDWARDLQMIQADIKALEARESQRKAQLKEFIADRMGVEGPFGTLTWKHQDEVPVKAFVRPATRVFRSRFVD